MHNAPTCPFTFPLRITYPHCTLKSYNAPYRTLSFYSLVHVNTDAILGRGRGRGRGRGGRGGRRGAASRPSSTGMLLYTLTVMEKITKSYLQWLLPLVAVSPGPRDDLSKDRKKRRRRGWRTGLEGASNRCQGLGICY